MVSSYSGTPPLGHLYSRNTSTQGTQNLVLEKRPDNICIYYLYLRDTSFQGKGTLLGPKTQKKCPLP